MTESQIKDQINTLTNQKLQYSTWLSNNFNSDVSLEEKTRVQNTIEELEKQINDLYDQLKAAPYRMSETPQPTVNVEASSYDNSTYDNVAIQAQDEARTRFYGMSKLKQSIARINGKKEKFEQLSNKAYDAISKEEQQQIAGELNKMFR